MPVMTALFVKLGKVSEIENITEEDFKLLEIFVVLYWSTCNTVDVNTARRLLFTQGGRSIENIPPTLSALKQHVLRSSLQAYKWIKCLDRNRNELDPRAWGWIKATDGYIPLWSELPEASAACRELVQCGCKKSCKKRCKCKTQELPCTELCACAGQCAR